MSSRSAFTRVRTVARRFSSTLEHFGSSNGREGMRSGLIGINDAKPFAPQGLGSGAWTSGAAVAAVESHIVYGHDGEYAMGAWKYRLLNVIEEQSDERAG